MKQLFKTRTPLLILTLVMLFSSCKKDKQPAVENTLTMLQNKNWKITALTVTPGYSGAASDDIYNTWMEACDRDNLFRFNTGNEFILDEGPTKCNPADLQTQPGTWGYNDAVSMLNFQLTSPADAYSLKIVSINQNSFVGTESETAGGIVYVSTWTFVKQ